MTHTEMLREQAILNLTDLLRTTPFTVEFRVRRKPAGIKIIAEVTRDEMDYLTKNAILQDEQQ